MSSYSTIVVLATKVGVPLVKEACVCIFCVFFAVSLEHNLPSKFGKKKNDTKIGGFVRETVNSVDFRRSTGFHWALSEDVLYRIQLSPFLLILHRLRRLQQMPRIMPTKFQLWSKRGARKSLLRRASKKAASKSSMRRLPA